MLRGGSVSNTVLAIEAQGSEFRAQHPPEKPGVASEVFVTPALWGEETGGLLGLAGHQPGKNPQSSRFGEILYLKRNKAKSKEGRYTKSSASLCMFLTLQTTTTGMHAHTHALWKFLLAWLDTCL